MIQYFNEKNLLAYSMKTHTKEIELTQSYYYSNIHKLNKSTDRYKIKNKSVLQTVSITLVI